MQEQMMAAARDILLEEGLAGLSMRKVAARCGVSATAIYRHFDDKDALVAAAVRDAFESLAHYLMQALAKDEPVERFRAICRQYFAFARQHERYYQLIFMTNCHDLNFDALDELTRERSQGTFQMLVDRVEECQRAGLFREGNSDAQAAFAWSTLHGLAALRITGNLDGPPGVVAFMEAAQIAGIEAALASTPAFRKAPALR